MLTLTIAYNVAPLLTDYGQVAGGDCWSLIGHIFSREEKYFIYRTVPVVRMDIVTPVLLLENNKPKAFTPIFSFHNNTMAESGRYETFPKGVVAEQLTPHETPLQAQFLSALVEEKFLNFYAKSAEQVRELQSKPLAYAARQELMYDYNSKLMPKEELIVGA